MSSSPKSKPESPSSRATGDAALDRPTGAVPSLDVELEVQRQHDIGWALFAYVVGALLIAKLGTVGVWVGIVLVAYAVIRTVRIVQTFLFPPGTFRVTEREVTLPRGRSMSRPLKIAPDDVTAVYFLRRSVPWNKSSPVLIVEVGDKAIAYPRDWFASEADQRHIVHALLHAKRPAAASDAA